jgi:hypothetical protein
MVKLTEAARTTLLDKLVSNSVPSEAGYRLAEAKGGYKLRLDRPTSDDRVIKTEGQVVFMVEPEIDRQLEGLVLDLADEDGERLVLDRS